MFCFTGPPEPPTNCTINYRSNDVTFFCTPNFDGGSNQTFAFQVLISNEYRTMVNKTVPDFSLMHFHSIRNLTIRVCSVNVEFPDMYACTEAFQASIYSKLPSFHGLPFAINFISFVRGMIRKFAENSCHIYTV